MQHQALRVNGASLHIAELGEGAPLLLLHGWPEFWLTWEPVMLRRTTRCFLTNGPTVSARPSPRLTLHCSLTSVTSRTGRMRIGPQAKLPAFSIAYPGPDAGAHALGKKFRPAEPGETGVG